MKGARLGYDSTVGNNEKNKLFGNFEFMVMPQCTIYLFDYRYDGQEFRINTSILTKFSRLIISSCIYNSIRMSNLHNKYVFRVSR